MDYAKKAAGENARVAFAASHTKGPEVTACSDSRRTAALRSWVHWRIQWRLCSPRTGRSQTLPRRISSSCASEAPKGARDGRPRSPLQKPRRPRYPGRVPSGGLLHLRESPRSHTLLVESKSAQDAGAKALEEAGQAGLSWRSPTPRASAAELCFTAEAARSKGRTSLHANAFVFGGGVPRGSFSPQPGPALKNVSVA